MFSQSNRQTLCILSAFSLLAFSAPSFGSTGTQGADFLGIPVGAGPAAMGSAYTALATNAYAPVWNPAGLGLADATGVAFQHLSYLESIHYEFASVNVPLPEPRDGGEHRGLGFSAQYLGSGDITRTDIDSNNNFVNTGDSFSSHYGAYNLAYGQTLGEKLSLGVTGKWINAQLDDVSANAYAADFGALYQASQKLQLAATFDNLGSKLKFIDEADSLPTAAHAGAAYAPDAHWLLSLEGMFPTAGMAGAHMGIQWRPIEMISLRAGYRTDVTQGLGAMAGVSAGVGLNVGGQEFAYAYVPYGDLGTSQYFSLLLHFGSRAEEKRNLIQYQTIKQHRTVKGNDPTSPDYQQLMQLLSDDQTHVAQQTGGAK